MSYPRKLHILVVEDDSDTIEAYRVWFQTAKKTTPFVEPVYVRSFSEAQAKINSTDIIHVVILDMNLPIATRAQPEEGLTPGEQLLEAIAKRDNHPIPVLLVVSGKLNLANSLTSMNQHLQTDFWCGRLINKGPEQYKEMGEGLTQALQYCDVGIHIRDGGKEWYPTISPREDDLIRRCALAQRSCIGVDLRWWGAENGPTFSRPNPNAGATKVLMGHFIFDDGIGPSLPTFFKFEPSGNGPYVSRDATILAHKLGHIKVLHSHQARERNLIVTQSVTNRGWPISFNEYLSGNPAIVGPAIPTLISGVIHQLEQLASREEDEVSAAAFFWDFLDRDTMGKVWSSCDTGQLGKDGVFSPLPTFDAVKRATSKHWTARRRCTHGDLNATNVAIDNTDSSQPIAYIFDAANVHSDFEHRDLATLEVTTILFNSTAATDLLTSSKSFYTDEFLPDIANITASPFAKNALATIREIRSHITTEDAKTAYILLLFNAVLQQLFGLGVQPSSNKIRNPLHVCYLSAWLAKWLAKVAPHICDQDASRSTGGMLPNVQVQQSQVIG